MSLMTMCPACGSDWCVNCECVRKDIEAIRAERDKLLTLDAEHTRREIGLRNELEALQQEKDSLLTELGALRAKEPPLLQCVDCRNTESCAGAMARYFNHGRCLHCGGYFKVVRA